LFAQICTLTSPRLASTRQKLRHLNHDVCLIMASTLRWRSFLRWVAPGANRAPGFGMCSTSKSWKVEKRRTETSRFSALFTCLLDVTARHRSLHRRLATEPEERLSWPGCKGDTGGEVEGGCSELTGDRACLGLEWFDSTAPPDARRFTASPGDGVREDIPYFLIHEVPALIFWSGVDPAVIADILKVALRKFYHVVGSLTSTRLQKWDTDTVQYHKQIKHTRFINKDCVHIQYTCIWYGLIIVNINQILRKLGFMRVMVLHLGTISIWN
jgi:hypothetical protein